MLAVIFGMAFSSFFLVMLFKISFCSHYENFYIDIEYTSRELSNTRKGYILFQ